MASTQHELYRAAVALTKQLGWPLADVPQSFALSEVENYVHKAQEEVARRKAAKEAKAK